MFQHILVALDGSESSLLAAQGAIELATLLHARLDMLSIEETLPQYVAAQEASSREHAAAIAYFERLHAPLRRKAEQRGVQVQSVIKSGHEGQVMLDYIRGEQCDLLVLGSQGHSGVWGTSLGSTADKVLSQAPCSTLIMRKRGRIPFKTMLLACDGSPLSWQAVQVGLQLAALFGATVHLLSVIEGGKAPTITGPLRLKQEPGAKTRQAEWDWQAYFQRVQSVVVAQAQFAQVALAARMLEGSASGTLLTVAREQSCDVVVLGATGQEHPWSAIVGGTARKVANEAPCAVLLVRPLVTQSRVRDLMSRQVTPVFPQTSLSEVMHLLVEQGIKLLVVVNEQQQVEGVITLGHLLTQEETLHHLDLHHAITTQQLSEHLRYLFSEQPAKDVMKRPALTVKADIPIEAAAQWMVTQRVTRVPVVDVHNVLVGMLDQAALLSYYTQQHATQEEQEGDATSSPVQAVSPQTVGDVAITHVPSVTAETPLSMVLQSVQTTPARRVIVVDAMGKAIGVIGENDLLASQGFAVQRHPLLAFTGRFALRLPEELFGRRATQEPLTAQQVMRPRLMAVTTAMPIAEAVQLMLAQHIKRLVVVDAFGTPLGMVDREHLLRSLVEEGKA